MLKVNLFLFLVVIGLFSYYMLNLSAEHVIPARMQACAKLTSPKQCIQTMALDFLHTFGFKKSLSVLAKHENQSEMLICHETLHYLAREEYDRVHDVSKGISECSSVCLGGCYHGMMEGYLSSNKLYNMSEDRMDKLIIGEISTFCSKECLHGFGHGIVFLTNYDIPRALGMCEKLQQSSQAYCYTGVLMENAMSSKDHVSKYFNPDDPMFACKSLPSHLQSICYKYASLNVLPFTKNEVDLTDWKKSIELCLAVPQQYRNSCFWTMGTIQIGTAKSVDEMRQNCNLIEEHDYRLACIRSTVEHLFENESQRNTTIQQWDM